MSDKLSFVYDSKEFVDLYEILEVEIDADEESIKSSYIKLAKKNHPDQGGDGEVFQKISLAYEILKNKNDRKEYDLYYLKKSQEDMNEDDNIRMKREFDEFKKQNDKPLTKEEIDKLYDNIFDERENDLKMEEDEFKTRVNDIELERDNLDLSEKNVVDEFLEENNDISRDDLFEYMNHRHNNQIVSELGTYDCMDGSMDFSLINENENKNEAPSSLLFSGIETSVINKDIENINKDDLRSWIKNKKADQKLTSNELDVYLQRRKEEEESLLKEVEYNLKDVSNKKKVRNFLKKNIDEEIN